jgi:cytochrome c oxidase assembly protein subunit 17
MCEKYIENYNKCLKENGSFCKFFKISIDMCNNISSFEIERQKLEKEIEKNPRIPQKKICCSCPETKKIRDQCNIESDDCKYFILSHDLCLIEEGFKIGK